MLFQLWNKVLNLFKFLCAVIVPYFQVEENVLLKLALYLASFGPGNVSALIRIRKHITLGPSDTEGFRSK